MPSKKPLNIVHVVDSLEFGGLERLVLDLTTEQVRRGHKVSVFSILHTAGFLKDIEAAGVKVFQGDKSKSFDLSVLKKLRAATIGENCDIVHAHNFVPTYYSATALFGKWGKRPTLVSTCHDMGGRLSNAKLKLIYSLALKQASGVSMVSEGVYKQYTASGILDNNKAQTIINGVNTDRFQNSPERRSSARGKLGLSDSDLVIGNVARLVDFKNHKLLIEVIPELVKTFPNLKLAIVGYGELEDTLRAQVKALGMEGHVILTGRRSDVADLLPAFDVYCVPSLTEGLPIALLEACASALPVVATNVGGNAEVIQDKQTGLIIPAADKNALIQALHAVLSSKDLRDRFAQSADRWVRSNASIAVICDKYELFYQAAANYRTR